MTHQGSLSTTPDPLDSPPKAAGFVLAGGLSTRMGQDKALVELGGKTLAAHAVALLRNAGLSATIAGARSGLTGLAPVIEDEAPEEGPLRGVCTALANSAAELTVFLSVDLPLLPASLLEYLVFHASTTGAAVTLASVNGFTQTFPVVLNRNTWPLLRAELAAGQRGCLAAFHAAARALGEVVSVLPAEMLAQTGAVVDPQARPAFQWFLNLNTPADVERAAGHRVS